MAAELDVDASRLAIAGDSAGGISRGGRGVDGPRAGRPGDQVPSPSSIRAPMSIPRGRSMIDNGEDYFLTRAAMEWFYSHYINEDDHGHHFVAPILADLSDLPPALIITAEFDPLRDEGNDYGAANFSAPACRQPCRATTA
jgi:acetyl esterase